jgi:hypothetical protein
VSAKFAIFTNAATGEAILVNPDHVRTAQSVPGHRRVKLSMGGEREEHVEGDLKHVLEMLEGGGEPRRSWDPE